MVTPAERWFYWAKLKLLKKFTGIKEPIRKI
jgi:hypothetical protein